MEQDKVEQNISKSSFSPELVVIAISVSLVLCLTIIQHWRTFGAIQKFLAVLLALSLLPGRRSPEEKRWKWGEAPGALEAYIWLMLAIMVFTG